MGSEMCIRDSIGGGQVGYNFQLPVYGLNFVTGMEADFQGLTGANENINRWYSTPYAGTGNLGNPFSITHNIQGNGGLSWLGTVRGRLGYVINPSLLIYGTGGLAYGGYNTNIEHMMNSVDTSSTSYNFLVSGATNNSSTMVGWTAGGGAEWMFLPNLSVKAEYLYYDLGNTTGSLINYAYGYANASGMNAMVSTTNYSQRINGNIVRAGVNYHFNFASAPVVAKF